MVNFILKTSAVLLTATCLFISCSVLTKTPNGLSPDQAIVLDTLDFEISASMIAPHRPAPDIIADIKHIELNLAFGLSEKEVYGKAKLLVSAYANPIDSVLLDAKQFEINHIKVRQDDSIYFPAYSYDGILIKLALIEEITAGDQIEIEIDYTARPTKISTEKGTAIESNQGLYFINTDRKQPEKPIQIWSQGEPESNSSWFPSIDHPHEKFTQDLFITVDTNFTTISNGKLIYSELHNDGTKTDYWKQSLEHSNYLVMIAIGEFAEVKDYWNDKEVFYYLDKDYAQYAKDIFGNTPEMLTFYSKRLDYEFPWEKYHQVVVKDFVSGAMENTSAVIHGDFVQLTKRELIDNNHEDVIAHELFHHWFGDLVTCKTWSQITLNEGFATYGEYLWKAYKYGDEAARYHLNNDLKAYLGEAKGQPKHLIRFNYEKIDDLFDGHSYQKGGRVLHMLRLEVGDDLFFKSLAAYLKQYQFKTAEIEDLRLVFERTTGRDLKWFFDQWFYGIGHPKMNTSIVYHSESKKILFSFTQSQPNDWPTFKFHVPIAISEGDSFYTKRIWIDRPSQTFEFDVNNAPNWVIVDPYGDLLWENIETKDSLFWTAQLTSGPSFLSRNKALIELFSNNTPHRKTYLQLALQDKFWANRALALSAINSSYLSDYWSNEIQTIAKTDANSTVRAQAIIGLDSLHRKDSSFISPFIEGLRDSSFLVIRQSLRALADRDPCLAAELCAGFAELKEGSLTPSISKAYSNCGEDEYASFFTQALEQATPVETYILCGDFAHYCTLNGSEKHFQTLINTMRPIALQNDSWYGRLSAVKALETALDYYEHELQRLEATKEHDNQTTELIARYSGMKAEINLLLYKCGNLNSEIND